MRTAVRPELDAISGPFSYLSGGHQTMPLRTPDLIPSVFVADSSGDDEDRASEVVLPQQRQRVLSQVGICVIECQQHRSPGKRSRFAAPVKPVCGTNANVAPTHQPTEVPLEPLGRHRQLGKRSRARRTHVVVQQNRQSHSQPLETPAIHSGPEAGEQPAPALFARPADTRAETSRGSRIRDFSRILFRLNVPLRSPRRMQNRQVQVRVVGQE